MTKKVDNNNFADLHVHTDYSDGIFSPKEVVDEALKASLGAVAITDHDSVDAIGPCIEAGLGSELEIIPAIELSASNGEKEIHILGYFVDWQDPEFLDMLHGMKTSRRKRMGEMIELLSKKGIEIPAGRMLGPESRGSVGRLHLARVMEEEKLVRNIYEAFEKHIGDGKDCHVKHEQLDYNEAISWIDRVGGVAVLAHPGASRADKDIPLYVKAGLKGIEVYHTKHRAADNERYLKIAEENGLLATGGSDCHGGKKNGTILLGKVRVSRDIVESLREESAFKK
ncbi:MAG: PHP domain-containing protein [Candidatus Aadella gelida]|nr:PHP domain-containing protein [Candidatus Aadella gelida]